MKIDAFLPNQAQLDPTCPLPEFNRPNHHSRLAFSLQLDDRRRWHRWARGRAPTSARSRRGAIAA
jgi:hypothetical protein